MLGIQHYFWRLIPANPILLRVVETAGKRKRDLFIRCAYLGLLVGLVIVSLLSSGSSASSGEPSLTDLAKTSAQLFKGMSYLQLGLVALLAPIFTAGAITQEKDSQTYDILLATPLSNGQIVLGSLLSRLFFIVALLVSGIPIFSITQIFGGVAIRSIVTSFGLAVGTAFATGALAMAIATFKVGTRRTIFSFYLFIVVYMGGFIVLDQFPSFHVKGRTLQQGIESHISWFTGLNPFLALRVIFNDPTYAPPNFEDLPAKLQRWPIGWYLSNPTGFYTTFMFAFGFLLVTPSILLLRRMAQSTVSLKTLVLQRLHITTGDRTRKPRTVWSNPIAWREAKTKASAARATFLRYGFIVVGLAAAVVLAYRFAQIREPTWTVSPGAFDAEQHHVTVSDREYRLSRDWSVVLRTVNPASATGYDDISLAPEQIRHRMEFVGDPPLTGPAVLTSIVLKEPPRLLEPDVVRKYLLGLAMVEFAVILLIVTNAAASTVTREKEDGTLDLLLSSPITSRYYIWGKLRGLVSFVLPLIAVPVASVLLFVIVDLFRFWGEWDNAMLQWIVFPEALILLPGMLVIVAAFAAILGMQMSLRCRTTVTAVMSSVGIVVGVCAAMGWCGHSILSDSENAFSLAVGSFSPFTVLQILIDPYTGAGRNFTAGAEVGQNRVVFMFATLVAVGVYTSVVWSMYRSMVKNFDMTLRKQSR